VRLPALQANAASALYARAGVPSRPRGAIARAVAEVRAATFKPARNPCARPTTPACSAETELTRAAQVPPRTARTGACLAPRGREGTPAGGQRRAGRPRVNTLAAAVATALLSAVLGGGCGASGNERAREYMPDMARGPAYKAFAPNPALRTGLTLQAPVPGTIARGQRDRQFHYGKGEEEAARAGRELTNPLPISAATIEDGRGLYQTYCLVCHGANGKGDGPLVLAGKIPTPPAYTSERVAPFPPGRIFHVVTKGTQKMPSYAAQLTPGERWKVVAYVSRTLQNAQTSKGAATP